jgi:hypothetical protein
MLGPRSPARTAARWWAMTAATAASILRGESRRSLASRAPRASSRRTALPTWRASRESPEWVSWPALAVTLPWREPAGRPETRALAEYLGHNDPGFTLRVYAHLMPSSEGRARAAVDRALGGALAGGPRALDVPSAAR